MQNFGEEQVDNAVFVEKMQIIFDLSRTTLFIVKATSLFISLSYNEHEE